MRRVRHRSIAFGSGLWLAACSVDLGSQGDDVPIENPPPSGVVTPGAGSAGPQAPAGPAAPGPSASADAGIGAPAASDGGVDAPDAEVPGTTDAASSGSDAAPARPIDPAAPPTDAGASTPQLPFALGSPAFNAGSTIPEDHTCKGDDVSPAFVWQGAPAGTKSFALVLTTHTALFGMQVDYQRWVMWNIPATRSALPAEIEEGHAPSDVPGAVQASNETDADYAGPAGGGGPGGGPGGGNVAGGFTGGGPGGTFGGSGSSDDAKSGRRYRGPCSYGFPQTFEFVLYALGAPPQPPAWRLGITPDEIVQWLGTQANVLGTARLGGVTP